eukprot:gene652-863_t
MSSCDSSRQRRSSHSVSLAMRPMTGRGRTRRRFSSVPSGSPGRGSATGPPAARRCRS